MPGADPDHDGHLSNLNEKSTSELIELLKTKEKFLQKRNFLRSLPDRGRKVEEYVEMLQKMIIERRRSAGTVVMDESMTVEPSEGLEPNRDSTRSSKPKSQFAQLRDKRSVLVSQDVDMDIEAQMRTMTVREESNDTSKYSEENNGIKELINTANAEKIYIVKEKDSDENDGDFINSYQKVMMKSDRAEKTLKQHFRPNSTLKITTLKELPENYRGTCKKNEATKKDFAAKSDRTTVIPSDPVDNVPMDKIDLNGDESSAKPPKYKYDKVKVISLEESFQLQQDQSIRYEDLRAQQAALRLASKLDIKMEPYNPEGGTDMSYRMKEEPDEEIRGDELDSDDNEEGYPD